MRASNVVMFCVVVTVACGSNAPPPSGAPPAPTVATSPEPVDAPEPEAKVETEPACPDQPQRAATEARRDTRPGQIRARPRYMLVVELPGLERLLQATDKASPDRPTLMRRTAEGYVELAVSASAEGADTEAAAATKRALELYLALAAEHPDYPKLDEVLYYTGYEYERAGDLAKARDYYDKLAREFPCSPYRARVPVSLRGR